MVKTNQYTGLQQYIGRTKRVKTSESSNADCSWTNSRPPAQDEAALEAAPEATKIRRFD